MKRILLRTASVLFTLCLLLYTVSAAYPQVLHRSELPLADSLQLETAALGGDTHTTAEHLLTYEPGGDVSPVVVYGSTLYGRSTMDYIADFLAKRNLTPVAAVNAAFFDMSNGIPYGFVVTDGILRSGGNIPSFGIEADGSFRIGTPQLTVTLQHSGGTLDLAYNKALTTGNGFCLYSRDYDTGTKNTLPAHHLILQADPAQLPLSGRVEAVVTQIVSDTASCPIPEDGFVLSLAAESIYASALETMAQFQIGDRFTITTDIDSQWQDVMYAAGGGDMLVENGQVCTVFTHSTANQQVPRTALGITASGKAVVYTVDRGSHSDGMTLPELAQRMKELGCRSAINLDGGGSTCLGVTYPGTKDFSTVNVPSSGAQRPCANFLFFVRPVVEAGSAVRLHVYPHDAALLPGGSVQLTVAATDENWQAAVVPGDVTLSAVGGTLSGHVFTADAVGTAVITAAGSGIRGSASVKVIASPTAITAARTGSGKPLQTLTITAGTTVDLDAAADYLGVPISAADRSFRWAVDAVIGSVSEDGKLTASGEPGTGTLQISCGNTILSLPVTVIANPFLDTISHWAADPIAQLYQAGTLTGSADSSGRLLYRPDDSMTRQEFVTALMRFAQVDLTAYRSQPLPFADKAAIADWAAEAINAAYSLGLFTGTEKNGQLLAEPARTISREQAMTILARFLQIQADPTILEAFPDHLQVSQWARASLAAMVEQGVVSGSGGKLLPKQGVTRGQMAKMLFALQ